MHCGALVSIGAIVRDPDEPAHPGLIAPDREMLPWRQISDGGPGGGGGGGTTIEEERVNPRAADEEIRVKPAIDHIIAAAAINSIVASTGINKIRLLGSVYDIFSVTSYFLIHDPLKRSGIGIWQAILEYAIANFAVEQADIGAAGG